MPSLRIQQNKIRFRLNKEELSYLMQNQNLGLHQSFGSFDIILNNEHKLQYEDKKLQLFVTHKDCQDLMDKSPSKQGIVFKQNDIDVHFELDIKKMRNTDK